jgi:hypothetical protein
MRFDYARGVFRQRLVGRFASAEFTSAARRSGKWPEISGAIAAAVARGRVLNRRAPACHQGMSALVTFAAEILREA